MAYIYVYIYIIVSNIWMMYRYVYIYIYLFNNITVYIILSAHHSQGRARRARAFGSSMAFGVAVLGECRWGEIRKTVEELVVV